LEDAGKRSGGKHKRRVPIWVWAVAIAVLVSAALAGVWIFRLKPQGKAPVDYDAIAKKYGGTITPPKGPTLDDHPVEQWNPVPEMRQKYPNLKDWSDIRILDNLSDPKKFSQSFRNMPILVTM